MHVCGRTCVCACVRVRAYVICVRAYVFARACVRARVRACVRACVRAGVRACVCACVLARARTTTGVLRESSSTRAPIDHTPSSLVPTDAARRGTS